MTLPIPAPVPAPSHTVGCDIGQDRIDTAHSGTAAVAAIPNTPDALAAWVRTLDPACLVVCEATGGHEAALLAACAQAGIPAHRADTRKVRAYIRSFGTLGKTDTLDAQALARYGQDRHARLPRWQPRNEQRDRLQHLVRTRAEIVADRTAWTNRRKAPGAAPVHAFLDPVIAAMDDQLRAITTAIETTIKESQPLRDDAQTMRTVTGIGPATAAKLLALMPELGQLTRKQAAALAGLAPHPNQSGKRDAYRPVRGGRPEVRQALFMAAMVAAKHNPTLRACYQRLIARGKKPLVALTALMRKIIVITNAKLRDAHAQVS